MRVAIFIAALFLALPLSASLEDGPRAQKWAGVDETVVGKFAREANRPPREPLLPTNQGDLLLFLFALAGAGAGFIGGYYFRELFPQRKKEAGHG